MSVGATLTFACGVGLAGLWWGLTVGLTVVTLVSLCQLAFVDWERETRGRGAEARERNARVSAATLARRIQLSRGETDTEVGLEIIRHSVEVK